MNLVLMYNEQFQVIDYWRTRNKYFDYTPSLLIPLSNSDFNESSSIKAIVESAFISNSSANISYSGYFSQCAAASCTYSIYGRQSIVIIVTSIIGVFSGLSTVLKLLTPLLVQVLYWCLHDLQGMQNIKFLFSNSF